MVSLNFSLLLFSAFFFFLINVFQLELTSKNTSFEFSAQNYFFFFGKIIILKYFHMKLKSLLIFKQGFG